MADGWLCQHCDTHNTLDEPRCVVCDHEVPKPSQPIGSEAPTSTFAVGAPSGTFGAATATTYGVPTTAADGRPGGRGTLPWILVAMGATAIVLMVVIIVLLVRPRSNTGTDASASTDGSVPASTHASTTSTTPSTVATTATPTTVVITLPPTTAPTTVPPTTVATLRPTVAPTSSRAAATPGGAASAPVQGHWTAVFISCDVQGACADAAQRFRSFAPSATLIAPGTYQSLRPFWIVAAGAFATGEDAAAFCRSIGRASRDDCFGRYLSQNAADVSKIVYPD